MLNATEIALLINEIYEGVERSKLGPILTDIPVSELHPAGKIINNLSYNAFLTILGALTPKNVSGDLKMNE